MPINFPATSSPATSGARVRSSAITRQHPPATSGANQDTNPGSSDRFQAGESLPDFMAMRNMQWSGAANGGGKSKVQQALANGQTKAALAKFAPDLQQQIGGLSNAQLKVLKGGMTGSTKVGPITVDNRKAFIKGSVAMKSIWGNVHQSITDARTKYSMIDKTEEHGLHKLINSVSTLKPDQRQQLASIMDTIR